MGLGEPLHRLRTRLLGPLVSVVAVGYLGGATGRAGIQLASEGSSPTLGLGARNLVWLSRVLQLALPTIVFTTTTKLGT